MGMFNPEVRVIEGSNVGTYNPPTVDYSGVLGNIGASIGNAISDLSGKGREVQQADHFGNSGFL